MSTEPTKEQLALMNKVGDDYGMRSQIQDITQGMDSDTLAKFGNTLDMCIAGGTHEDFLNAMSQAKASIISEAQEISTVDTSDSVAHVFNSIDRNRDGKASPEEINAVNKRIVSQGGAPFPTSDKSLTENELADLSHQAVVEGFTKFKLNDALDGIRVMDTDKDGKITKPEIPEAMRSESQQIPPAGAGIGR